MHTKINNNSSNGSLPSCNASHPFAINRSSSIPRSALRSTAAAALLLSTLLFSGCVVKDLGSNVGHKFKGDYYLQYKQYDEGKEHFEKKVTEDPTNASARYYYGRFLLQSGEKKTALSQLKKARDLEPDVVEYHFWTGVAYGEVGSAKEEAKSYQSALRIDKDHLQSRIYLGHNLLERKKYSDSLKQYDLALGIWPQSPSSLYNRALILKKLGRTPEEKRGWHDYLASYPTGALARRATDNLNALGDFSFRNHHLGARTVTIEKIWFEPVTNRIDSASKESLQLIGSVLKNRPRGTLQVIAFQKKNKELAKIKATAIKRYILKEYPEISPKRIGISWFDQPQTIVINKKKRKIDESISFFITDPKK